MVIISIISGLLSTMNVWVDNIRDINLSINDVYMSLLMTGWMIFFMGLYDKNTQYICYSTLLIITIVICIRKQLFVNKKQYYQGMIPHHSMAVLMSKQLLKNDETLDPTDEQFVRNIIDTQETEISSMKNFICCSKDAKEVVDLSKGQHSKQQVRGGT